MIRRPKLLSTLRAALRRSPVVALLGPRQCGKTTLAKALARAGRARYFDLEDPSDLGALDAPALALSGLRGLVILDEIQRKPDLLPLLRVLADRPRRPARFLLLGSAAPHLVRGVSETLAGRVALIEMGGFDLGEIPRARAADLWMRGSFPPAFLARDATTSLAWRRDFVRTFLERDLPQLGITIPAPTLRRFWMMVAHFHGRVWNAADFARSLGTTEATARRYLDVLTGAYVVRQLPPWYENLAKRQVKAPKVYVRDSGLLHALLGVRTRAQLLGHPQLGASFEGFAVEQAIALAGQADAYFWATHAGAELDLLLLREGRRIGLEMKRADAPSMTRSMHVALADLRLDRLLVVVPGDRGWRLAPRIEVVPIARLGDAVRQR